MKRLIIGAAILSSLVGHAQQWENDLDSAFRAADASNRNILLYFSVADACESCIRLENTVFSSAEFNAIAENKLVLVKEDFADGDSPESKAKHLLIVEKYNKDGFFPFVLILNKDGKILKKSGAYNNESASAYLTQLELY